MLERVGGLIGLSWIWRSAGLPFISALFPIPKIALLPLLILWLGLGFKVKVAVIFLMSSFPICINTWLGVTAVPKSLIDVGKSFVASDAVILRRIVLPVARLPDLRVKARPARLQALDLRQPRGEHAALLRMEIDL